MYIDPISALQDKPLISEKTNKFAESARRKMLGDR